MINKSFLLLVIFSSSLFASSVDFALDSKYETNLEATYKTQTIKTNIDLVDTNFNMIENFDYSQSFYQAGLKGSALYLQYDLKSARATQNNDKMDSYEFFIGNDTIKVLSLYYKENENSFSTTQEVGFLFYGVFEQNLKDFKLYTSSKESTFNLTRYSITTEHVFYRLAQKKAYNDDSYSFYLLSYAYSNGGFRTYGSAYYSFDFYSLKDLEYKDSTNTYTQNTEELKIMGKRYGYKLNLEYNYKALTFALSAEINKIIADTQDADDTNTDTRFNIEEMESNLFASLRLSF